MNTTPGNSLVSAGAGDTLDNIRDALALVAAALAAPWEERWRRTDTGLIKLLGEMDGALEALAQAIATETEGQHVDDCRVPDCPLYEVRPRPCVPLARPENRPRRPNPGASRA